MRKAIITGVVAGIAMSAAAQAADTVTLKVADSFPVTHLLSREGPKFWMERAAALSEGSIEFEYYPGQQLGKAADMLRLTQSGVTDIGYIAPSYVSERMPLSEAMSLPGMAADSCSATEVYWQLANEGVIREVDFDGNEIRPLFAVVLPPYQFFGPANAIRSLADFDGLKIRSGGGTADLLIDELGGVPVKLTAPETREALERGTVDLHLGNNSSQEPYGHLPFIKFGTTKAPFTSFIVTYSISQRKWDSLSAKQQQALADAGAETNRHLCEKLDEEDSAASKKMQEMGAEFYVLTDEDRANFVSTAKAVAARWAAAVDGRGKPGTKVLEEIEAVSAAR